MATLFKSPESTTEPSAAIVGQRDMVWSAASPDVAAGLASSPRRAAAAPTNRSMPRLDFQTYLSVLPPTARDRRLALTVVSVAALLFAVTAPFAKQPLGRVDAFIPAYEAVLVIADLITAVLLLGQFRILRSHALLVLASGYFFTALIVIPHALALPGLFAPTGLLGAGAQTTAWLYMVWHSGFPLAVIGYALLKDRAGPAAQAPPATVLAIAIAAAVVVALVGGITLFTTTGRDLLPRVMTGDKMTPAIVAVVWTVWGVALLALLILWSRRRSVLDLWLTVVMCAWVFEIGLSTVLNAGRYDLGFYAGRIYSLLAVSFVLIVLLAETSDLYGHLAAAKATLAGHAQKLQDEVQLRTAELTRANAALHVSEERLRRQAADLTTLIEKLPFGVNLVGPDLRFIAFNAHFLEVFDLRPDMLKVGDSFEKLIRYSAERGEYGSGDIEEQVRRRVERALDPAPHQFERKRPNGRTLAVNRVPLPAAGFVTTYLDVTDRRKIEQQLMQSQKMEAVGQLTGGLAHDFNNLLGVIVGNLEMALEKCGDRPDTARLINEALTESLRGAELNRRLLAFSRRQPLKPAVIELPATLDNIGALLHRTLGEEIILDMRCAGNAWPVELDRAQLESAVLNLAVNARDAMPKGGRLTVEAANVQLDESYCAQNPEVQPGEYVMLAISDTGTGMTPDVMARIFEPFFTTKETGKGTGLGLSMVFGFVRQSGGHIKPYSEPGKGTTFKLYFPRVGAKTKSTVRADDRVIETIPRGRREVVLVVDDNEAIRKVVVNQIERLGYTPVVAPNAHQALDLIRAGTRVDVLFSDVVMPGGLSGYDLAREARRLRPGLPVLLTSGFAHNAAMAAMPEDAELDVVSKPYRRLELAERLRRALDRRTPAIGVQHDDRSKRAAGGATAGKPHDDEMT